MEQQPYKPTKEQYAALIKAYRYYNKILFFNKLPTCILNFSNTPRVLGFMAANQWGRKEHFQKNIHEISLSKKLLQFETIGFFSTLVHEMVHLWQFEYGTPSKHKYHNKEWAWKMKEIGLIPSHTGEEGGKETGEQMSHYIEKEGRFEQAFHNMPSNCLLPFTTVQNKKLEKVIKGKPKINAKKNENKTVKRNTNKRTYLCQTCGIKVWGKPDLIILCGICNSPFTIIKPKYRNHG